MVESSSSSLRLSTIPSRALSPYPSSSALPLRVVVDDFVRLLPVHACVCYSTFSAIRSRCVLIRDIRPLGTYVGLIQWKELDLWTGRIRLIDDSVACRACLSCAEVKCLKLIGLLTRFDFTV